MKPEEQSEIILWDWLKTKGDHVNEVYFNRKNNLGWKTFSTSGINKKPDFIIEIDKGYGKEYVALEIKNAKTDRAILDSSKIIDYYLDYINRKTVYYIDNKQIEIKHFVVSSENSIKGYLFKEEKNIVDNTIPEEGKIGRLKAVELKLIPFKEYERTRQFTRTLFENFSRLRKKINSDKKPSIGILTSNFYDNPSFPHLFTMIRINYLNKKHWGQRFWRI